MAKTHRQVLQEGSHRRLYLIQLIGFVARSEAEGHRLQVNAVRVMRTGNCKGLVDPGAKDVPLKLPHPRRDLDGTGRERTGPLRPHHLQVIADHSKGGA